MPATIEHTMFVTPVEDSDLIYGHCYSDDDEGHEFGCGMEYEYDEREGKLAYWHDAVGLVNHKPMTPAEWDALAAWHDTNCGQEH